MKTFVARKTACCVVLLCLILAPTISYAQGAQSFGEWFERSLGSSAVPELVKQYGGVYIVPIQERLWLDEVFQRLVEVTERKELDYNLTVLDSPEYNAFALPGGYLFVTRGLLKAIAQDEAKLAAVLGHEIAHVEKKHGINAVLRQMGLTVLVEVGMLWLDVIPADLLRVASTTLLQLLHLGWGREAEYEADAVGQSLAVRAGFDGIGAVALLDDLLEADSFDLPMKVFRTHPDTKDRRYRVEERLTSFWSIPQFVPAAQLKEILIESRNYDQNRRSDPNNRFFVAKGLSSGLEVYDAQSEQRMLWLEDIKVKDFAWSPTGQYLALVVEQSSLTELWFVDRYGHVVQKLQPDVKYGRIVALSWSPRGEMLALQCSDGVEDQIMVTYVHTEVYLPVSGPLGGKEPIWLDEGLYFLRGEDWYHTSAPPTKPVVVPNPVPLVLQRQRILSPTVIREGDTIRLTRPSLVLP